VLIEERVEDSLGSLFFTKRAVVELLAAPTTPEESEKAVLAFQQKAEF
jgi:hypothetical protein